MWRLINRPSFVIVEQGAGSGLLCHDMLNYLQNFQPLFYNSLQYYIIEISDPMVQQGKELLKSFHGKVQWINNLSEAGSFTGCLFSNELLDNFPVHRVSMAKKALLVMSKRSS
jgi:SAM-dependent MidA family methyltransferase